MIQRIECVGAKLQVQAVRDLELPAKRQIHLRKTKAWYVVAPFVALLAAGRHSECGWIESFSSRARLLRGEYSQTLELGGACPAKHVQRRAGVQVRAGIGARNRES